MRRKTVTRLALAVAANALAGCVYDGSDPSAPEPLAADKDQPVLALFERVLAGYFLDAGPNWPTTCAASSPTPLTARQEEALILRFVRLAPASRCRAQESRVVDSVTGGPAVLVQVYDFACRSDSQCSAWAAYPGAPATRHTIRFEDGLWRHHTDPRIIAE